jgi:hypothetical protein
LRKCFLTFSESEKKYSLCYHQAAKRYLGDDMIPGTFGTAINCMDGRVQEPVINWLKAAYNVDYIDMITEPGPDKVVSEGSLEAERSIKAKVAISVEIHDSKVIAVAGHVDCAGNPVSDDEHKRQILESVEKIKSWNLGLPVVGLWINHEWQVERLGE